MKVAVIITSLEVGGAEKQVLDLIINIKDKITVKLFVIKENYHTIYDKLASENDIDIVYVNKKTRMFFDLFTSIKLSKKLEEFKPDVIHTNLKSSTLVLYYYLKHKNFKWLHTIHSLANIDTKYFRRIIMKSLYKKKIIMPIAVSNVVRDSAYKLYKIDYQDIEVIHNGIEIDKFERTNQSAGINFIFVGRIEKVKNVGYLISEFAKVLKKKPDNTLYILGDGSKRKKYEKIVQSKRLEKNIIFTGNVSNVSNYLNKARVFILPSFYEGFPIALVEAMVCKNGVLANNVGGTKELLIDGVNGYSLTLQENDLCNKILRMIENPNKTLLMGEKSNNISKQYSITNMCEKYVKLFYERKRRIVITIGTLEIGGAEVFVTNLLENINLNKYEVLLIVLSKRTKSILESRISHLSVRVKFLDKKNGFSLKSMIKTYRILKKFKPDIIHGNLAGTIYSLLYVFLNKVTLIHTTHSLANIEFSKLKKSIIKFGIKKNKIKMVAISKAIRKSILDYYQIDDNHVTTINNGINIEMFRCQRDYDFQFITIGHVGRLEKVKNHKTMIEVFEKLNSKYQNLRMVFIGNGSLKNSLQFFVKDKHLENKIFFLGQKENVAHELQKIDIFFMPSFYEGMPLSVLEALSSGCAIIASNVGGLKDIIIDDVNGFLVDDPQNVELFVEVFERLLLNNDRIKKMSLKNMKDSQNYSIKTMVQNYEKMYGE